MKQLDALAINTNLATGVQALVLGNRPGEQEAEYIKPPPKSLLSLLCPIKCAKKIKK